VTVAAPLAFAYVASRPRSLNGGGVIRVSTIFDFQACSSRDVWLNALARRDPFQGMPNGVPALSAAHRNDAVQISPPPKHEHRPDAPFLVWSGATDHQMGLSLDEICDPSFLTNGG